MEISTHMKPEESASSAPVIEIERRGKSHNLEEDEVHVTVKTWAVVFVCRVSSLI